MKLIITIDTEEDNWQNYSSSRNPVTNIERIVQLQHIFDKFRVKPTYLITYPVAMNPRSVDVLKEILDTGKCEIGSHCHPWNTPPFEEEINEYNSMLCNLPEHLQYRKLKCLHEVICQNFGVTPVSFRAGRWGFSDQVARSLIRLGYLVDTSVTPFTSWGDYKGADFSGFNVHHYRFDSEKFSAHQDGRRLLEVPATIGFLQGRFECSHRIMQHLETGAYSKLHVLGILSRLNLLNKVWLSPELASAGSMIKLAKRMHEMNFDFLNMSFHSTSLVAGYGPFVTNEKKERLFSEDIEIFLKYAADAGFESMTLSGFENSV